MAEKQKKKGTKKDENFNMLFALTRRMANMNVSKKNMLFNDTEMRLIGELINAQMHGKQIISTQIAKSLGITRSAVSQIVDRLENQNIVKRVADKVDRKIAYVELTEEGSKLCKNEAKVYMNRVNMLIEKFGEENFKEMCALFHSFCDLVETEK